MTTNYSKLPPMHVELIPCDTVCIDLIGHYIVTDQKGKNRILNAMTFVDPVTCWFEDSVFAFLVSDYIMTRKAKTESSMP